MYYYGARYYNPAIGRFASQDPWEGDLENPQSLNKYSYVMNNPLKYIDPTGMWSISSVAYDFLSSTIDNVINVVPNTVNYVKEFGIATYYGAKAIASNDEQSQNYNTNKFVSHTAKMTDSAEKSLDGVATITGIGLGIEAMNGMKNGFKGVKNSVDKAWYKSTFKNTEDSFNYHYDKHVLGEDMIKTKKEYFDDASKFFEQHKNMAQPKTLNDGSEGFLIKQAKGNPGGYFSKDGKPTSFWYK